MTTRKNAAGIIAFLAVFFMFVSPLQARDIGYYEDPGTMGMLTRAVGMGRAFTAICDDDNAVFVNPSGLGSADRWRLGTMYTSLLGDVNYFVMAYEYPLSDKGNSGIEVGYLGANVPGIAEPSQSGISYAEFYNNILMLAYGSSPMKNVKAGATLKYYSIGYSGSGSPSGTGFDIDLGATYAINERMSLGLTLKNILPASTGGRILWTNDDEQTIPAAANIGLGYSLPELNLLMDFDLDMQIDQTLPSLMHAGGEWKFSPFLKFRAGLDQSLNSALDGTTANICLGVGLSLKYLDVDYAYHPFSGDVDSATHFVSISFSGDAVGAQKIKKEPSAEAVVTAKAVVTAEAAVTAEKPGNPEKSEDLEILESSGKPAYYFVREGETLDDIAKRFYDTKYAVADILRANHLSPADRIKPDWKLLLPYLKVKSFVDVPEDLIGHDEIIYVAEKFGYKGYPENNFRPNDNISRAEFISLFVQSDNVRPEPYRSMFDDVGENYWAKGYINYAKQKGYITGYPDGTFKPRKNISFAEAELVLERFGESSIIWSTKRSTAAIIIAKRINKKILGLQ